MVAEYHAIAVDPGDNLFVCTGASSELVIGALNRPALDRGHTQRTVDDRDTVECGGAVGRVEGDEPFAGFAVHDQAGVVETNQFVRGDEFAAPDACAVEKIGGDEAGGDAAGHDDVLGGEAVQRPACAVPDPDVFDLVGVVDEHAHRVVRFAHPVGFGGFAAGLPPFVTRRQFGCRHVRCRGLHEAAVFAVRRGQRQFRRLERGGLLHACPRPLAIAVIDARTGPKFFATHVRGFAAGPSAAR